MSKVIIWFTQAWNLLCSCPIKHKHMPTQSAHQIASGSKSFTSVSSPGRFFTQAQNSEEIFNNSCWTFSDRLSSSLNKICMYFSTQFYQIYSDLEYFCFFLTKVLVIIAVSGPIMEPANPSQDWSPVRSPWESSSSSEGRFFKNFRYGFPLVLPFFIAIFLSNFSYLFL